MVWTIIGIIASITVTCGFIPQIMKGVRTKRLDDVSPGMYILIMSGMCLWITYGVHLRDAIIIAANVAALLFSSTVLFLRCKYRPTQSEKTSSSP